MNSNQQRIFTTEEEVYKLAQKSSRTLIVFKKKVYDMTLFLQDHPGGRLALLCWKGKSIDKIFHQNHGKMAEMLMKKFLFGEIREFKLQNDLVPNSNQKFMIVRVIGPTEKSINNIKQQEVKDQQNKEQINSIQFAVPTKKKQILEQELVINNKFIFGSENQIEVEDEKFTVEEMASLKPLKFNNVFEQEKL